MPHKPHAPACDNNKGPILDVLRDAFAHCRQILEIGSGTGQHAVHFAAALPHLHWQTSDLAENHAGIQLWISEAGLDNIAAPLLLDVSAAHWPVQSCDGVFTANTTHIMPWSAVQIMMARIGALLPPGGVFCQYGPFNYDGRYTSDSNAEFDRWLKQIDGARGIRDFEAVQALAETAGLQLRCDHPMPANNRLLEWVKAPVAAGSKH